MGTDTRNSQWEWLHSFWILWTFVLGYFGWVAFLWIGFRTRQKKWLLIAPVYLLPLVINLNVSLTDPGLVPNLATMFWLVMWAASVIHAFRVRKEYLLRLKAMRGLEEREEDDLQRRIEAEYQAPLSLEELARLREAEGRRELEEFERKLQADRRQGPAAGGTPQR